MRKKFKLRCEKTNSQHTIFRVFDQSGASCGLITIRTVDYQGFIGFDWNGDVDWNGNMPQNENERMPS